MGVLTEWSGGFDRKLSVSKFHKNVVVIHSFHINPALLIDSNSISTRRLRAIAQRSRPIVLGQCVLDPIKNKKGYMRGTLDLYPFLITPKRQLLVAPHYSAPALSGLPPDP